MRSYLALTKVLLKTGLNMAQGASSNRRKKRGKYSPYLLYLLIIVCFMPLMAMLYAFGSSLYAMLQPLSMELLGLQTITYAGSFVVLIFGLPYVLSAFFLANDLQTLLPLPLKPWQILAAKFTTVAVYEYLFVALMVGPMLVGYGVAAGANLLFWLQSLLTLLILPATPLVYASLLAIVLMRLLKNMKHKESLTTIGSIVMIFAIVIGSNLLNGSNMQGNQMVSNLLANQNLLGKINYIFPNLPLVQQALHQGNLLWMLAYLLSAVAFVAAFLCIGNRLYFSGVLNMWETSSHAKKLSAQARREASRPKSQIRSYFLKEVRTLLRTPTYLLNCLLMPFLLPVIMLIPMALSFARLPAENWAGIRHMIAYVPPDQLMAIGLLTMYGVALVVAGSNYTLSTCISREGRNIQMVKALPMSFTDQLRAKVLSGYLPTLIAMAPYLLAISLVLIFWGGTSWLTLVFGLAIGGLTALWVGLLQLWADLRSPKLDWENEQAAVKDNFSAFISMMVAYAIGALLGVLAFFCYRLAPGAIYGLAIAFLLVSAGLCYLVRRLVYRYGNQRLAELE